MLNSVKVFFEDSQYDYTTSVSSTIDEKAAKDYFVDKMFSVERYPLEVFKKCIKIEFKKGVLEIPKEFQFNAYDAANFITQTQGFEPDYYQRASDFLLEYEKLGELIGDDDNPFNPNVNRVIELEESFLKSIELNNN